LRVQSADSKLLELEERRCALKEDVAAAEKELSK
jgi:hypothetical protein